MIKLEAKILMDCLDGHSRSKMWRYMVKMYYYDIIRDSDLEEFSPELRELVKR